MTDIARINHFYDHTRIPAILDPADLSWIVLSGNYTPKPKADQFGNPRGLSGVGQTEIAIPAGRPAKTKLC